MNINQKLNLVIPVELETGDVYVHATPISREVFESNFLVISRTFAAIYGAGLSHVAGPRVAKLMLKTVAEEMGIWAQVERSLMAEMRRLAVVVAPGKEAMLLQEAEDKKLLSPDDVSEVENAITFFTVASAMHTRTEAKSVIAGAARLWGAGITSLNATEYVASLPTSTGTASTGATAAAS